MYEMRNLLGIIFLFWTVSTFGQTETTISLESPHAAVYTHLFYLQPEQYHPELAALPFRNGIDSVLAKTYAIQLKQILDGEGLYVLMQKLPVESNYVDSVSKKSVYTLFPVEMPQIYLEKVNDKWYYSKETIANIPKLHKKVYPFGSDILVNLLPISSQKVFLGLAIWQIIGMFVIVIFAFIFYELLKLIIKPIIQRISRGKNRTALGDTKIIGKINRQLTLLIVLLLLKVLVPILLLTPTWSHYVILVIKIFITVIFTILIYRIWALIVLYAAKYAKSTKDKMDEQLLPIITKIVQFLIIAGGAIYVLQLLNVNVTALIAGVSIGGLALALASQDTVKNLIGSVMIFIDKPFQIDDYIEVNGQGGTIVEVGFRTTRVRMSDSSILSIPNGNIANMAVINKGVRTFRLFQTTLGITYDTSPALIEKFISGLKNIIEKHPSTDKENYLVNLTELGASSINILFRVPLLVGDYATELNTKEELLFSIMRLAEDLDVSFAFPSTSVYIEKK